MRIVWDEPKRRSNLEKHGLDFADLDLVFFVDALLVSTRLERLQAIGRLNGSLVVSVVYRALGREALSVISLRPASEKERLRFEQGL